MPETNSTYPDSVVVERYGDDITVNKHRVPRRGLSAYLRRKGWNVRPPLTTVDRGFVQYHLKTRYWVDTPRHHFLFTDEWEGAKRKALCWAAIMYETGLREMESNSEVVPIKVAALGKPYVAAYMYAAHELGMDEIGAHLDVSPNTVSQYLTDVGKLRR